jgi:hypothetical protein
MKQTEKEERIASLRKELGLLESTNIPAEDIGDGKGVFFGEMTDEEYEEYDHLENKGWKGFINKVKNIGQNETDNK